MRWWVMPLLCAGLMAAEKPLTVVAFLDLTDRPGPNASRRHAVMIESMLRQYGGRGLKAVIVPLPATSCSDNVRFDWHLTAKVECKGAAEKARAMKVTSAPMVLLLDSEGKVAERVGEIGNPAALAAAIDRFYK